MSRKQFVIVGLGRFGRTLAETLYEKGEDVLAIDLDEERVEDIRNSVTHSVQADAMDMEALRELGVRDFDVAVVTIGTDIKASGMATMLMKEVGVKYVIAKAHDEIHGRMLQKLGADKVIFPERDMGRRVAHNLISGNILDFIELSPDYSMVEIQSPAEWGGRTLRELDLRNRMHLNVIAIKRNGEVNAALTPETMIHAEDRMLVMATEDTVRRLKSR
ncbi:MAG TPA: TrkA family potassium uptake protein [Candidatus Pullichristensenella excrementigallinarum]|uniref:TrkA family potassium uptake protein n=1 Tax=Candidatus Pullichristensenella excrementigallinarum TaxID=2840907 RepID=A0A9D1LB32_9FIRM|nr:TrkA family potassium uptake protein [Candidatus Pullichristensenella excrementigallinarum]